jgi:RNA-directed DNA polymerase
MLAPQPGRTGNGPRPTKILSKAVLSKVWAESRDSTTRAGRPGIDKEAARQFGSNLDSNLAHIARQLGNGTYGFSKLRVVFVPKPDSDRERVICIPTVRDRLVQRAIGEHIRSRSLFPIYNNSSFGFIKGLGPHDAIERTLQLREAYPWCLKTDIQSFFDKIGRPRLRAQVKKYLRGSSLEVLVLRIVDCEVKLISKNREQLRRHGLTPGLGIRQGMPLSPLLANLALVDFDKEVEGRGIEMVRYADDLALFFRNKEDALDGRKYIKLLLKTFELSIPEFGEDSKTKIISRSDPLEFLGREIVHLGRINSFVARVSQRQIDKIKTKLMREFSFDKRLEDKSNLQDTVVELSRSIAAYLGIYRDAHNYRNLENELKGLRQSILTGIFRDLFGYECLQALSREGMKFLGIEASSTIEPNVELDV